MTDLQAAIGCAQMKRLPDFTDARRARFQYLAAQLFHYWNASDYFIEPPHDWAVGHTPSPFGFPLLCRYKISRNNLARFLDKRGVGNRPIFAGNILLQPGYREIRHRVVGELVNTNYVHQQGLWIGCWPGLSKKQLDYSIQTIKDYFNA